MNITVYDPTRNDPLSKYRGGGRVIQLLKENLPKNIIFTNNLNAVSKDCTLLIPCWYPFQPPLIRRKYAKRQILFLFDVILQKYPHHFPVGIKGNVYQFINKWTLNFFDKIITISNHSKNDIGQIYHVPTSKIQTLYLTTPHIYLTKPSKKLSLINSNLQPMQYILYVGDVNWNKNLITLAKALKYITIPCVFVGSAFTKLSNNTITNIDFTHPWQKSFQEFVHEIQSTKKALFLGYVDDTLLQILYQNALCNVLVSYDEGFGLSYIEAASQRCPSILSNIEVFHETAANTALFTPINDPLHLANAIEKLKNITIRKELGDKAYTRYTTYYHPKVFKQNLISLLNNNI